MNKQLNNDLEKKIIGVPIDKEVSKEPKEIPTCQFYIVLGKHDREFISDDKNKYFPVVGNEDIKLIQYALGEEWKKKKKDNIKVANEIIFLVSDISYRNTAEELIEKLNCRGRVRVIPTIKKEIIRPTVVVPKEKIPTNKLEEETIVPEQIKEPTTVLNQKDEQNKETSEEISKESILPKEEPKPTYSYKKENNIYHGDFEKREDNQMDAANYMGWDEKLLNKSQKKLVRTKSLNPNRSAAFIDLPIIIFILSSLLLIGSIILLFVLK